MVEKMKRVLCWMMLCLTGLSAYAQDDKPTETPKIDSAMAISPAYMPVSEASLSGTFFLPLQYEPIDTTIFHTSDYDPFYHTQNLYQTLGIIGQAHKNMIFGYDREIGFSLITLPYPLYFKTQKDLKFYDLETSFTNLAYTYGTTIELTSEHHFRATHAQNFKHVSFAGNLFGYSNKGYFMRQGTNLMAFDLLLHYQTPRNIYGFTTSYIFNRSKYQENGGLSDYHSFADRPARDTNAMPRLGSYSVVFKEAASTILTHDLLFQQYVNIKDKKDRYYGTLSHSFQFKATKCSFLDENLNNEFYQDRYFLSTDTTYDTLYYHHYINTLQWSNFDPLTRISEKNYALHIAGGIQHEFVKSRLPRYIANHFSLFARTHIRLFKVWDIYGSISYSFLNYTKDDAIADVSATFALNRKWRHYLGFAAGFYRVSPDFFFTHYYGNNNYWYHEWPKENNLKLSAFYTIFDYKLSFNYFMLNNYLFINSDYLPQRSEKSINVVQLNLFAPLRLKNFKMDVNMSLQHATQSYVAVPLFTGKLYAAYCFRIFRNRLKLMVGGDIMYNTSYYADAYNPLLHQFYHQESEKVGNYLYFDANLTMQVQRIAFFFRAGNIIAGAFGYDYCTTPNYPMQGLNFEVGITWKFYD